MIKKVFVFLLVFAATSFSFAQTILFSDNFDSYAVGSRLASSNSAWTTWNNAPGTSEDGVIYNAQAVSAPNSLYIAGTNDQLFVMPIKDNHAGHYQLSFSMFVPEGSAGYFNVMHYLNPNVWAFQCDFYADGTGKLYVNNDSIVFSYVINTWCPVLIDFDLDNNLTSLTINNTEVSTWPSYYESFLINSNPFINYLAAIDFYSETVWKIPCAYYIDNFVLSDLCGEFNVSQESVVFFNTPDSTLSHAITLDNSGNYNTNWKTVVAYDISDPDTTSTGATVLTHCPQSSLITGMYAGEYEYAVMFPASMLQNHVGKTLRNISFELNGELNSAKIRVYAVNNPFLSSIPGNVIYEQSFDPTERCVTVDTQIVIDGRDLWVGLWIDHSGNGESLAFDSFPNNGYSYERVFFYYGGQWIKSNYNLDISISIDGTPITPWLTISPNEGSIGNGEALNQVITVNGNGMQIGDVQTAKLYYYTSAFNNYEKIIPVIMEVTGVSVNEYNQIEVSLYPNPATDHLQVVSDEIQRVEVYNMLGQRVFDQFCEGSHVTIPTSSMVPGTYVVTVISRNNRVSKQVVIR